MIVSAYNRPRFLELALHGFARQTDPDFEIVVADDGSGPEVAGVIERIRSVADFDIRHVWHEDRGFRKTEILNRAVLAARGDYLVFTDGDCIPRDDFVAPHRRLSRPGCFLTGGYLKLPQGLTDRIDEEDVATGRLFEPGWLLAQGFNPGRRGLRLTRSPALGRLFDLFTPGIAKFHGNNASAWRDAVLEANGFDNDWGYSSEDRALGERLRNAGMKGIQMRHRTVTMHLEHPRPYASREARVNNGERLRRVMRGGVRRAENGIAELGPDPSLRIDGEPAPR